MTRYIFFFLIISLLFTNCTKEIGHVIYGDYPYEIGKIMQTNCATTGCHNALSYDLANGLNLSSWSDLFKGSNNGSPVIPFNSKYSSLCNFINTYPELGLQNTPTMPLNQKALGKDDVLKIKNWIDDGARNYKGELFWNASRVKKKLYSINQGCGVVTVFDSETQLPIRVISVGTKGGNDAPHQIKVSPDGKYWYVVFVNNNIMQKYSCVTDELIANIQLSPQASGTGTLDILNWNTLVISADGKLAYLISYDFNGALACVDLEKNKLLHIKPSLLYPHGIALNAKQDKIYVTAQQGNYIIEIDTAFSYQHIISLDNNLPANLNSSLDPHDILLAPNLQDLWITCQTSNQVRVFNLASMQTTSVINVGCTPQEIVYSKSTNCFYATCMNDTSSYGKWGSVVCINANNAQDVKKVFCGFQPHGIAIDESSKLIYVLSRNQSSKGPPPHHSSLCAGKNGFVNFIQLDNFLLSSKKIEMSVDPYSIFAQP